MKQQPIRLATRLDSFEEKLLATGRRPLRRSSDAATSGNAADDPNVSKDIHISERSWIGADLLHLGLAEGSKLAALLVATAGALLFGGVLGALQWLVIRQRVPLPRKKWIVTSVAPGAAP